MTVTRLLGFLLFVAPLFAAEPEPLLDYDFAAAAGGRVPNRAPGGAELALSSAAEIREGALRLKDGGVLLASAPDPALTNRLAGTYGGYVLDSSADAFEPVNMTSLFRRGNEIACAFEIRFDRASRRGADAVVDFGMFTCTRTADGTLEVALRPGATAIMAAPLVMRSRATLREGDWHHVAFNYSWNRRRYSLYLDGRWQMENSSPFLPESLAWMPLRIVSDAQGALRHLVLYDAALESEELVPCRAEPAAFDALRVGAEAVARSTVNPHLRRWAGELTRQTDAMGADTRASRARFKRLERDLANARTLADALQAATNAALVDQPVTCYAMPVATQERVMPGELPRGGRLTRRLRVLAARGQYADTSVVIVPFRPVQAFRIEVSELKCESHILPAAAVDVMLVKRWYRSGGAWMTYHADKRQRLLVPDLLLHNDRIVRVDEFRQTNELLMHFEEGDTYVDVSGYETDQRAFDHARDPFWDAPVLQPLTLPEAGRNQQFLFEFHVPETTAPGLYHGTARLFADDQAAGELEITLRVLPFVLPAAKTYYDLDRTYFSHINTCPGDNEAQLRNALALLQRFSLYHASGIADAPWKIAIARELGYPLDELVGAKAPGARDWLAPFGAHPSLITSSHKPQLDRLFLRALRRQTDFFEREIGSNTVFYAGFSSEADYYPQLVEQFSAAADLTHTHSRGRRFSHSMNEGVIFSAIDTTDMDSTTRIDKQWAELWHAVGGRQMNYCVPFPGPENPAIFRRDIGLRNYKAHYDGQMLHGYRCNHWNEFCDWPEDNAYRNFSMAYPQRNALIPTLALVGTRAAYDDVRYATKLRELALAYRDDTSPQLAREARRQLAWLERLDGATYDLEAFRAGAAHRILTLLALIQAPPEGETP